MKIYNNVDEYIKKTDKEKQAILRDVRELVRDNFKSTKEEIAYSVPAYKYNNKPFFYFAAQKGHFGIYPTPGPIKVLEKELGNYFTSKGCVRISYNKPLLKSLILKLLKERVKKIQSKK
jgi:uncharacterized protein YdhG (YjbR/CyaY superfamily)